MTHAVGLVFAAVVHSVLAGVDTTDALVWSGTISFKGTVSCKGAQDSVEKHLKEALGIDSTALDVFAPELSNSSEACTGTEALNETFIMRYIFVAPEDKYASTDKVRVAMDAEPSTLDAVKELEQVDSSAEFQAFERVSGTLSFNGGECGSTTTLEEAIAAALGISPILVQCKCADNTMAFTVSAPAAISSQEEGAYRAQAVQKALDGALATKMQELGEQAELAAITVVDFEAGNNEAPSMTVFVKGVISLKASNVSCVEVRTATSAALMSVLSLMESQVKVEDICAGHSVTSGISSQSHWRLPFEFVHVSTADADEIKKRVSERLSDGFGAVLLAKIKESHAHATELDFLREELGSVSVVSPEDAPEIMDEVAAYSPDYSRAELASAAKGQLKFEVAAKCAEVKAHAALTIAKVLKISTAAVEVESSENCDGAAVQEISEKIVNYLIVVPASVYGSDDATELHQTLTQGLPPVLHSAFQTAGLPVPDGKFVVAVTTEHQQIELVKGSLTLEFPQASCGQVVSATIAALAETLQLRSMYLTASVASCASDDDKFGVVRRLLAARVAAKRVDFNVTLPAATATLAQEVYRASHVEAALQGERFRPELLRALKRETVGEDDTSELTFGLESVRVDGFTNPELDEFGELKTTTTAATTTTTKPAYSTGVPLDPGLDAPENEVTLAPNGFDPFPHDTSTQGPEAADEVTLAPGGNDPFPHDLEDEGSAMTTTTHYPNDADEVTLAPGGQDPFPHDFKADDGAEDEVSPTQTPKEGSLTEHPADADEPTLAAGDTTTPSYTTSRTVTDAEASKSDDDDGSDVLGVALVVIAVSAVVAGVAYFFLSSGADATSGSQVGYEMSARA